jgi:uncharacterized protein (UPF0332 family)
LATESERYLRKAQESLASAEADLEATRYNSAANRAYYAAFQAAVAALISQSIRPATNWEHNFVTSQFSGRLIKRRKVISARLASALDDLFDVRVTADYRSEGVSARAGQRVAATARDFVETITGLLHPAGLAESPSEYGVQKMGEQTKVRAEDLIADIERRIRRKYPDAEFEVLEISPTDYRLQVWGDFDDDDDIRPLMHEPPSKTDMLIDHGIRIVVLALGRRDDLN